MALLMLDCEVLALLAGRARPFRDDGASSAIAKLPVSGAVRIGVLGLQGDEQADPVHHGGPDKALHHYPADHYPWWRTRLGEHPELAAGGFGENISTLGLTERDVCLGDRFRLGGATIEVSHGRQPCWKLGHRFGDPSLAAQVTATRASGWYYRVIEPGEARAGDRLTLVGRVLPEWNVARLFALLIGGGHKQEGARDALAWLAELPLLAEAWRERARELLG